MGTRAKEALYKLALKNVQALKPYEPGKPLEELEREYGITEAVKLASNENPLGMSNKAQQAIINASKSASLYPDGSAFYLKKSLAAHLSEQGVVIDETQITIGNGSNEILEIIARSYADKHSAIMYSQHAFAVYPIVTQSIGATHQMVAAKNWGHDLDAMLDAISDTTKVIFIANPNNPTGTILDSSKLRQFIQAVSKNIIVIVDEAYHEYVNYPKYESAVNWLAEFENLIVTRTFSKAYGLAGLRIGYSISNPATANILNRVRQPFNANALALAAATQALEDQAFIRDSVAVNESGKRQLYKAFEEVGLTYIPSQGNFIAIDVKRNVNNVDDFLLRKGVIIRPIAAYQMPTFIRVSIGTEVENARLITALQDMLNELEPI